MVKEIKEFFIFMFTAVCKERREESRDCFKNEEKRNAAEQRLKTEEAVRYWANMRAVPQGPGEKRTVRRNE